MNKLKIAVLDNGVDEKLLALCGLPDIIQQNKGNISDEEDLFLHGTNCAMIIGLNCADAELYSYKLLDNTGKVCGIKVWILQLHRNTKSGLEETI